MLASRTPPVRRVGPRLRVRLRRTLKGLAEMLAFLVAASTAVLDALTGRWPEDADGADSAGKSGPAPKPLTSRKAPASRLRSGRGGRQQRRLP